MTTSPLQRSVLTQTVLDTLKDKTGLTIGDGILPEGNWIGQPNLPISEFDAFAVLSELAADHSEGPLGASQGDWRLPYMLEYFAISREQVSWVADKCRGVLVDMRGTKLQLGVDTYKTQLVRGDNIGAPTQIDVTYPSFWHQQDGFSIWMGKEVR